jgi:ubiquinone/menaquinone biosynthesis C-methylase UbiE
MTDYLDRPAGALPPNYAHDAYDEVSLWASRFGAILLDRLEPRRNIEGLDIACGAGFPLLELAHMHGRTSRFTGLDLWGDALARASGKTRVFGMPNVFLVQGNAESMPFDDASFDLVTSNLGINNFERPAVALDECFRVVRDGGRIALTTNLTGHMAEFYDVFRAVLSESNRDDLLPKLDAQEAHRGTRESTEALISGAGFRITNVVEGEFFLPFADGSAMLRHPLVNFFLWGWRGVTDERAIYARIEERLNDASPLRMRIPTLYVEAVRPPRS